MKTNKLINTKYKFSKNLYRALIAPCLIFILALIFGLTLGVNKGMDIKGGIVTSVVAGTDINLYDTSEYNQFKQRVDNVLKANDVNGQVYTIEVNEMQEYTLVVKFSYEKANKDELITNLKNDLINEFYSSSPIEDIENNNYVFVSTFGNSIDNTVAITTVLATVICAIVMCIYIMARMGLNAGVMSFLASMFNNIFVVALTIVARVPVTYASVIVFPFVTIISILATMIYLKKTKELITSTDKYEKQSNFVVADDAVKQTLSKQLLLAGTSASCLLVIGLLNVLNSVLFVSIALFTCVACMLYTNLLLVPGLYARTYVRKVRKNKKDKQKIEQKDTLTQEQVMKETDLDNLVSN